VSVALGLGAVGVLSLASCSDRPTEPTRRSVAESPALKRDKEKKDKNRAALLTDVPVAGTILGGGTFTGTFTATHLSVDPVTHQLTMQGVLNGTATTAAGVVQVVDQAFSAPMSLSRTAGGSATQIGSAQLGSTPIRPVAQTVCDILFLDLGPLHLDLLGLTIDLAEVILDLNAVTGGGNLLGNLLCALLGLLDPVAVIAAISQIIDMINNLLAGASVPAVGGASLLLPAPTHGAMMTTMST
jgi:hypothetical protein